MTGFLQAIANFAVAAGPSLLMIAAFALAIGGINLIRKGNRQKGVLMIICALVFFANVLLFTL